MRRHCAANRSSNWPTGASKRIQTESSVIFYILHIHIAYSRRRALKNTATYHHFACKTCAPFSSMASFCSANSSSRKRNMDRQKKKMQHWRANKRACHVKCDGKWWQQERTDARARKSKKEQWREREREKVNTNKKNKKQRNAEQQQPVCLFDTRTSAIQMCLIFMSCVSSVIHNDKLPCCKNVGTSTICICIYMGLGFIGVSRCPKTFNNRLDLYNLTHIMWAYVSDRTRARLFFHYIWTTRFQFNM